MRKREINLIYLYTQKKSIKILCLTIKRKKVTLIGDLEVKCNILNTHLKKVIKEKYVNTTIHGRFFLKVQIRRPNF